MDKVQQLNNSTCETPSSQSYRIQEAHCLIIKRQTMWLATASCNAHNIGSWSGTCRLRAPLIMQCIRDCRWFSTLVFTKSETG